MLSYIYKYTFIFIFLMGRELMLNSITFKQYSLFISRYKNEYEKNETALPIQYVANTCISNKICPFQKNY